ncbi:pyocin activator PrtN family protein [uncultured Cohaesibacter sp.]|uniref:pyocin activator PrtN family protein n=1 Tax=uncultured Cohaesibacter sp. TaxID=1002546 RepID=UPI0029C84DA5|nr:pyocin activator PrtN family protein [uncultured Cohaesibacter sp.]
MNTVFLLMAQYNGQAVIPLDKVREDFFASMDRQTFMRKINNHKIDLPVVQMEKSQKSARGVHLGDLATYIDARRQEATKINDEYRE